MLVLYQSVLYNISENCISWHSSRFHILGAVSAEAYMVACINSFTSVIYRYNRLSSDYLWLQWNIHSLVFWLSLSSVAYILARLLTIFNFSGIYTRPSSDYLWFQWHIYSLVFWLSLISVEYILARLLTIFDFSGIYTYSFQLLTVHHLNRSLSLIE